MDEKNFLGKKISSDAELIMWLSSDENKKIDLQNVKFPFAHMNYKLKGKDFDKLIKTAKQCELFYRHKCKNEYIHKYCLNCDETNFHQNDLIRFINIETFFNYMKYIFLVSNNIVAYSKENFNNNKNDLEKLLNNYKEAKEKWKFTGAKILCKQCMFKLINKPNFCENIKQILFGNTNISVDNNIQLNEENNFIDFNKISYKETETKKINIFDLKGENLENKLSDINSNIIINYNNLNNNIFNTVIFNNNNLMTNPLLNNIQYINSNYIETKFLSLKNNLNNLLNLSQLYKQKQINKIDCLSKIQLLNKEINHNFNLLDNSIKTNLFYINNLILKYQLYIFSDKIILCIFNNKNMLDLLNRLLLDILSIENIFIGIIINDNYL